MARGPARALTPRGRPPLSLPFYLLLSAPLFLPSPFLLHSLPSFLLYPSLPSCLYTASLLLSLPRACAQIPPCRDTRASPVFTQVPVPEELGSENAQNGHLLDDEGFDSDQATSSEANCSEESSAELGQSEGAPRKQLSEWYIANSPIASHSGTHFSPLHDDESHANSFSSRMHRASQRSRREGPRSGMGAGRYRLFLYRDAQEAQARDWREELQAGGSKTRPCSQVPDWQHRDLDAGADSDSASDPSSGAVSDPLSSLQGQPVLFVPGSAGSYEQVSSLAPWQCYTLSICMPYVVHMFAPRFCPCCANVLFPCFSPCRALFNHLKVCCVTGPFGNRSITYWSNSMKRNAKLCTVDFHDSSQFAFC